MQPAYDTLSQALAALRAQGYVQDFNLEPECLYCASEQIRLRPEDFHVQQTHRFEGPTDPADNAVLYAIASVDGRLRGTLVNAYGTYAEPLAAEMRHKLGR